MTSDKEELVNLLGSAADMVEGLQGNEDALNQAIDHIEKAIDLIVKYALED